MMRKVHRWLSVIFGIFLLWISATGFLSQVGTLVNNGGFEKETQARGAAQVKAAEAALIPPARAHENEVEAARPAAANGPAATEPAIAPAGFVCPADMTCRPKRVAKPGDWNVGYLHHLHSGEEFGPLGVVVSMLSGLALFFFAFSGLYLYIQMYRGRLVRTEAGKSVRGGRFFW